MDEIVFAECIYYPHQLILLVITICPISTDIKQLKKERNYLQLELHDGCILFEFKLHAKAFSKISILWKSTIGCISRLAIPTALLRRLKITEAKHLLNGKCGWN